MLEYIDSAVTRNASEKKINSLLDFMAQAQDIEVLQVRHFLLESSNLESFLMKKVLSAQACVPACSVRAGCVHSF